MDARLLVTREKNMAFTTALQIHSVQQKALPNKFVLFSVVPLLTPIFLLSSALVYRSLTYHNFLLSL